MMTSLFKGAAVAITTPFSHDEVDYATFEKHVNFLIEEGLQALFVNGTTGEGSTLTEEERLNLIRLALKVSNGRVPIIANTGTNDTRASLSHSLKAKEAGADAIMLITPYYNKTSQRGLIKHFTLIADAVGLPVVLYNVPSRTNMTIEPETLVELAKNPHIVALKDATGDMEYLRQCKELLPSDFAIYSGNDDAIIPFFEGGGDGVISVLANATPKEFQEIYTTFQENPAKAKELFEQILPLIKSLSVDINPMPIKALVNHLGYAEDEVRLPLVELEDDARAPIEQAYHAFKGE